MIANAVIAALVLVCSLGAIAMVQGSRMYCRLIVSRARQDRAERDGIDFNEFDSDGVLYLTDDQPASQQVADGSVTGGES